MKYLKPHSYIVSFILLLIAIAVPASPQSQVMEVKVHSRGLENNLLGDSADQVVGIYLPAAYTNKPGQCFPTVYFLHGFADTPAKKVAEILQKIMDRLIDSRTVEPMIVVAPNGLNRYLGSFYANSIVTGNWEDFIVRDVVGYVDSHYRTLASSDARGISGHSMGGYGSLMLAFKHPDVFSNVYAMSPCCTVLEGDLGSASPAWARAEKVKSAAELTELLSKDFMVAVAVAMDAALAPDPKKLPLMGDSPFRIQDKHQVPNPDVFPKFQAQIVSGAIPSLLPKIYQLKGIYIDYGAEDNFSHIPLGARTISAQLADAGVPHVLEVYDGDHGSHVVDQAETRMLPWFSRQLKHGSNGACGIRK